MSRSRMTLRTKLSLMFFGAVQVTFLTAVGGFWAVQSWQLLTDDLTLIHEQSRRLERTLDYTDVVTDTGPSKRQLIRVRPGVTVQLQALRDHAQTLEETELIGSFSTVLVGTLEEAHDLGHEIWIGLPGRVEDRQLVRLAYFLDLNLVVGWRHVLVNLVGDV